MNRNLGLIITASDQITPFMSSDRQKELLSEYKRRAANREHISGMFNRNCITPLTLIDPTSEALDAAISQIASQVQSHNLTYIYINCHGNTNGLSLVLNGHYTTSISYSSLKTKLDTIPGIKVLMIESCHSGESITKKARSLNSPAAADSKEEELKAVNIELINTFKPYVDPRMRKGELRDTNYYVLAACHGDESAWGNSSDGNYMTNMWCEGAGWDYSQALPTTRLADYDKTGFASLTELVAYTRQVEIDKTIQNDMCYPENYAAMLFGDVPLSRAGSSQIFSKKILEYYNAHGDYRTFGSPVGPLHSTSKYSYQDFTYGIIIEYSNGTVIGHTKLRYVLERLRQVGKIGDGSGDNSLELYIVVKMYQDRSVIEESKRWPDYSAAKHGGTDVNIVYSGKAVTNTHKSGEHVFYDSLTLNGESHIYLTVEVWDWDRSNANDKIRTYNFDLNIDNGWGFDANLPLNYQGKTKTDSKASYTGIYQPDTKILLNMSVIDLANQ